MFRQDAYHCKHCGKRVPPEGVYCKYCGLPLGPSFREETGERRRGKNPILLSGPDRYSVESRLAQSDWATIDLARDLRLGRQVLIRRPGKAILVSSDGLSAFLRALRTAARLRHPGIQAIFEEGSDRESAFAVLEYIEGVSIKERLEQQGRLGLQEVLRLGVDLAEALLYSHQQGVIHGNLTPARVILDHQGRPRIHSFVRIEIPEQAIRRTSWDPPDMNPMSPCIGDDVYALGMLLRTCLLGEPGPADDPAIPVSLREILAGALALSASERWQSMEEFRDALAAVGGRRLRARDGRCPECGVLDMDDHEFCGNCGSNLSDLFRTCDSCGHQQHQRHQVCGKCGSNLEEQGKLALEQVFLALLVGAWDSVAREIHRLRLLSIEFDTSDAEHGAGILLTASIKLEEQWRQGRWETIQIALPLIYEVARTLGILPPSRLKQLSESVSNCTRLAAEAADMARDRRLSESQRLLALCRQHTPSLSPASEELSVWIESMIGWFEERRSEARQLLTLGNRSEAQMRIRLALEQVSKDDPLALAAQKEFFPNARKVHS